MRKLHLPARRTFGDSYTARREILSRANPFQGFPYPRQGTVSYTVLLSAGQVSMYI